MTIQCYNPIDIPPLLSGVLQRWQYDNGHLCRVYQTSGWKSSLLVVNCIGHLAETAWHHPDLELRYNQVKIQLMTHDADGITDKDFELARQIEQIISWQPQKQEGALSGPPQNNSSFAHVIPDV